MHNAASTHYVYYFWLTNTDTRKIITSDVAITFVLIRCQRVESVSHYLLCTYTDDVNPTRCQTISTYCYF